LSAALEFRNYEALSRTNQAMYDHLTVLRTLSFKTQQEQSLLGQLAIQGQRDSKSVKALTLIATMYLPMSMLAVSNRLVVSIISHALTQRTASIQLQFDSTPERWGR